MSAAATTYRSSGRITLSAVRDGTSTTILLGEKHVPVTYQGTAGGGMGPVGGTMSSVFSPTNNPGGFGQSGQYGDGDVFDASWETHFTRVAAGYGVWFATDTRTEQSSWPITYMFGSPHKDVMNFTMADGSVRSFSYSIDAGSFATMCTRAGNETIDDTLISQ